jgi:hypothetical protein
MGVFSLQRPTARRLRLVVQIDPKRHDVKQSRQKLARIEKALRVLIRLHKLAAKKRRSGR